MPFDSCDVALSRVFWARIDAMMRWTAKFPLDRQGDKRWRALRSSLVASLRPNASPNPSGHKSKSVQRLALHRLVKFSGKYSENCGKFRPF